MLDYYDGAYYKSINASGIPTGSWSSADEPSSASSINGGFIDTENNKLWLFDYDDGAHYKSIDVNGVPIGSWSSADEPSSTSNIRGGFIDTENNKLWLFDWYDGAYYKLINASGVLTGNWSSASKPSSTGYIEGGFIDTDNNKLWLFDLSDGAYYRSLNNKSSWSSTVEAQTIAEVIEPPDPIEISESLDSPTNFAVVATETTITATWDIHTNSDVTGYEIQYCDGANCDPDTLVSVTSRM